MLSLMPPSSDTKVSRFEASFDRAHRVESHHRVADQPAAGLEAQVRQAGGRACRPPTGRSASDDLAPRVAIWNGRSPATKGTPKPPPRFISPTSTPSSVAAPRPGTRKGSRRSSGRAGQRRCSIRCGRACRPGEGPGLPVALLDRLRGHCRRRSAGRTSTRDGRSGCGSGCRDVTPGVSAKNDRLLDPRRAGHGGDPVDLLQVVDGDPADPGLDRSLQLGVELVVAVHDHPRRQGSRPTGPV